MIGLETRTCLRFFLLSGLFLFMPSCGPQGPAETDRAPNVILIVVDTLRADYLGRADLKTPVLDEFAREGVEFDKAFSHVPITLPAHTALFASRYAQVHGVVNNAQEVPIELPLLANWLGQNGYDSQAVISMGTLAAQKQGTWLDRGFDQYDDDMADLIGGEELNAKLFPVLTELKGGDPFFLFAHYSDPHVPLNAHGTAEHPVELIFDNEDPIHLECSDSISLEKKMRFSVGEHRLRLNSNARNELDFVVNRLRIQIQDGHHQRLLKIKPIVGHIGAALRNQEFTFEVPEVDGQAELDAEFYIWINEETGPVEMVRRYELEVEYVDRMVGLLLDELRSLGLYENSLIIFTSDHGEGLGTHELMGHVHHLYDEAIHVPLMIKLPRKDSRFERLQAASDQIARHIDLVPTILDLLMLPDLPGQMGESLLVDQPRIHFAETRQPAADQDLVALRDEQFKMIYRVEEKRFEMYDLVADPQERLNVYQEMQHMRPDWIEQLKTLAKANLQVERVLDEDTEEMMRALGYL